MLSQCPSSGRLQSQQDGGESVSRELQNGGFTAEGNPEGAAENSLQKYSLKLGDYGANEPTRIADGLCGLFRRSIPQPQQPQAQLQKTYSQYNLTQLSNVLVDESWRKKLDSTYGLLARRIQVPPSVWEQLCKEYSKQSPMGDRVKSKMPYPSSIFGLPVMHPYSPLAVGWRCAMLLFDLSFTAFLVPLNVGFCFTSYGDLRRRCTRSDLAGGIVYVINWIVGFHMGVLAIDGTRRLVVRNGISVAKLYVQHGKFIIDALAAAPFFVLVWAIATRRDVVSHGWGMWSLLSLLRLARLLRLFKTVEVVYKDSLNGSYHLSWISERISVPRMFLVILGYQFLAVINLCASLMILLATFYGQENGHTWFDGMKWVDFEAASPPRLWFHSAYWVVTVLTTTGQGQAPRQLGEQIVSNFCAVYGMVFSGLVVGVVSNALMRGSGDAVALLRARRSVARATAWAAMRNLLPALTKELQVFFAGLVHLDSDFNREASYIEDLPTSLRQEVLKHIMRPLMDTVHIFSELEPEYRDLLASMFRPVDVPPNHDLCRQGTLADRLWIVEHGTVVARRHSEVEAYPTTGMACLLGETVFLRALMEPAEMRPWTLRTTEWCRLWELHWADIERMLRIEPSVVEKMLMYVKDRLLIKMNNAPECDRCWCELVEVLCRVLKQWGMLDSATENLDALAQANMVDGSLPLLISFWLEAGIGPPLGQQGGANTGRRRGLVTMSQMLARPSNDAGGSNPRLSSYGGTIPYPLAAPSPAIMSHYSGTRGGGGGSSPAANLGIGGGNGAARRVGLPGNWSPRGIVPAVSPALLMAHSGGGDGGGDPGSVTVRSPGGSGELPQGLIAGADVASSGGAINTKPVGGWGHNPRTAKRSRSFSHGALESPMGSSVEDDGKSRTTDDLGPQPSVQSQTQPQLALVGGIMAGRTPASRSRFASTAPTRQVPWVEAVAASAASMNLQGRHLNRRASLSDDGMTAADHEGGVEGSVLRTNEGAAGTSTERGGLGTDDAADADLHRLSVIAHTPFAYAMVDAGGLPVLPCHGQLPQHGQQQHLIQQLQQQQHFSLSQSPFPLAPVRSGLLSSGGSVAEPAPFSPRYTLKGPMAPSSAVLMASVTSPGSSSPNSQLSPRGGSAGGGVHRADILNAGSPRARLAAECSARTGSAGGGGNSTFYGGPSGGALRGGVRQMLDRAWSAHMLPLVPEEEGVAQNSSDGDKASVGGDNATSGSSGGEAAHQDSAVASEPLVGGKEEVSAPSTTTVSTRHAVIASGIAYSKSGGGGTASSAGVEIIRHRSVSCSRSASLPGPPQPSPQLAGLTGSLIPGVKEDGSGAGIVDCSDYAGSSQMPAAAAAATESSVDCTTSKGQLIMPAQRPPLPQQLQPQPDEVILNATASGSQPPSPLLYPRISAVSPLPITSGVVGAAPAGAEVSSAAVSERLPQIPLPDRVSRLRVRTGAGSPIRGQSSSLSNADVAVPAAGPHSPTAAGTAGGVGPCLAPTFCSTCGKCTCAECRARVMAAARKLEQGAATVVVGIEVRSPQPPYSPRRWGMGPVPQALRDAGVQVPLQSSQLGRTGAGAAITVSAMRDTPSRAGGHWARDTGSAGRGPETWRKRRASVVMDLGKSSLSLMPY
ncbi:hypothetical protein VaNZ11_001218 [Volvox africanus]|uniref:Cyclic nucleotide-binding domain-containing protein n=1 Tax=Volvox africanus TaxID=51714 RepID=A0ABQ5RQ68_9CHLO|nr:hypothetical protein VaNZ11_001218 [Volvox africanus]